MPHTRVPRGWIGRLLARLLPPRPDFLAMLAEQYDLVDRGVEALLTYLEAPSQAHGDRVHELEHGADKIKRRNLDILHRSFLTPFDREDLYRLFVHVDQILNRVRDTVASMQALDVAPDDSMRTMAALLREATEALAAGIMALATDVPSADSHADRAIHAQRQMIKAHRRALVSIYSLPANETSFLAILRVREIYHDLATAARGVERTAEALHDLIVKSE